MTLYDRIGGEPAVNAAVERFYVRVLADPMLSPFFRHVDKPRLKTHQFAFLSQTLGGPSQYSGAAMSRAHAGLEIERLHFDAVAAHLLDALRVSEGTVADIAEAVTPFASQIARTAGVARA